jgi:hypothetical protein
MLLSVTETEPIGNAQVTHNLSMNHPLGSKAMDVHMAVPSS